MKTINLFALTRVKDPGDFSRLLQCLSDRPSRRPVGEHEAESLRRFTRQLCDSLSAEEGGRLRPNLLQYLDGFWFSYTIAHISKEFDLLKISGNEDYILNVELKSEDIGEDRIRGQLEQNRYYLSNVSRNIYSFTYVMETNTLYQLNDRRYLKQCSFAELAAILQKPVFSTYVSQDLDRCFRASDYLISPVGTPDRLLQDKYFLTNQQWEFRRFILERIREFQEAAPRPLPAAGAAFPVPAPAITVTGEAGTGKTLLLFDLAIALSKKKKVLFLHGGPLREGHHIIDSRLKNVLVRSDADDISSEEYAFLLIDEANRLHADLLTSLLRHAADAGIPCVLAYDPHSLLGTLSPLKETETALETMRTHALDFSGNIRINRPVFSFLRALFHQKDRPENADYSCIDVLYAADLQEERLLKGYYRSLGYKLLPAGSDPAREGEMIGEEYEKVLMILDAHYYYDDGLFLHAEGKGTLLPLYEGLSRTREKLCLIITANERLFSQVLSIRL